MKALLLAAGLGTRLRPLTDHMPKALVPVAGQPLLHHTLRRLISAGATEITVNVHHHADQIEAYLRTHRYEVPVSISDERDLLRDTGGALRHAFGPGEREDILIHNVDILSDADIAALVRRHTDSHAAATLLVSPRPSSRQLLFSRDSAPRLMGWTNVQTGEVRSPHAGLEPAACLSLAFAGIHIVSPRLLRAMQPWPEAFSIIDFYLDACASHTILAHPQPGLRLLDVGKTASLPQAEEFLRQSGAV